jgi:hypothetical protein
MDTYAPALPKNVRWIYFTTSAIFHLTVSAGDPRNTWLQVHENYDPIWRHVRDPEAFLSRKCPNAESILEKIEGKQYLTIVWLELN